MTQMTQIFVFGASIAYGVGGETGGWADLIKQKLHTRMYSKLGTGEKYELYNFAKPGEPISFVLDTYKYQFEKYKRKGKAIILVSTGGNNSKAENEPDNFISTPEQYHDEMFRLLTELKENSDAVIFVGTGTVDEFKTQPKFNPLTGKKSYFTNARRSLFEQILSQICTEIGITFIQTEIENKEWIEKYLSSDGLHPNQNGHKLIADKIWPHLVLLLD